MTTKKRCCSCILHSAFSLLRYSQFGSFQIDGIRPNHLHFDLIPYILWVTVERSGKLWERRSHRRSVVNVGIEQMFLGQYRHKLDEKGRISIPAKFRELLGNGAYLIQGFDRNLRLLKEPEFEALKEKIDHMNMADPAIRQLRRLLFANASHVELDRIGRVLVPQFLREVTGIENEVVIVGVGTDVEIWTPDSWTEQEALLNDPDANAQRFAELDLSL